MSASHLELIRTLHQAWVAAQSLPFPILPERHVQALLLASWASFTLYPRGRSQMPLSLSHQRAAGCLLALAGAPGAILPGGQASGSCKHPLDRVQRTSCVNKGALQVYTTECPAGVPGQRKPVQWHTGPRAAPLPWASAPGPPLPALGHRGREGPPESLWCRRRGCAGQPGSPEAPRCPLPSSQLCGFRPQSPHLHRVHSRPTAAAMSALPPDSAAAPRLHSPGSQAWSWQARAAAGTHSRSP